MQTDQSIKQRQIAENLSDAYGFPPEAVRFFKDDEPWLGAEELMLVARKSPDVQNVHEDFDQFIEPLKQVVHTASVVLKDGRTFQRTGIAKVGERLPGMKDDEMVDEHLLAASRAIRSALIAAGINPAKPQPAEPRREAMVTYDKAGANVDDAAQRDKDLKEIHALAWEAGLIVRGESGTDHTRYRNFLHDHLAKQGRIYLDTPSAASLDTTDRASVISALREQVSLSKL